MKNKFFTLLLFALVQQSFAQNAIIPAPVNYQSSSTNFLLDSEVNLDVDSKDEKVQVYAKSFGDFLTRKGVALQAKKGENSIKISLNKKAVAELGEEGYKLDVHENGVQLTANQAAGIFNGLQTLKQLFPAETLAADYKISEPIELQGCTITDYPRFGWRGAMLDVSRHFFTVDEVKTFIDKMSEYKLNIFHWHLTDDEGWRIEIKSLPKLTEVGAWRVPRHGKFGDQIEAPKPGEKATDGGFYTQEQIKDVIQYAAARNITIVPEIDIPGHSMAALAAYPELSVKKEPKFVSPGYKFSEWYGNGKFKMLIENTLNPTDEKVYEFVDKIFTEVAQLFPSEYIHMGGDECYHGYWEESADVQKFMKKNKIKDTHELQSYFVTRVNKIIKSKGKKMIGWDEILEGGLTDDAAVMSWRGMKGGIEAAKKGHKVVMSPTTFAYLDYTQGDPSVENLIYASLSLEKAYSFEPVPENVNADLILGGQGNLWTEMVVTMPFAFYMVYPRVFAIAESVWTPKEKKDWNSFVTRTEKHFDRFDAANENISKAVLDPIVKMSKKGEDYILTLENNVPNTEIFYTINNSYPAKFGDKYTEAIVLPDGNYALRAQTFRDGKAIGRELYIDKKDLIKRISRKEISAEDLVE